MSVAVFFAIDCTGSMGWMHKRLKEKLSEIVQQFNEERIPVFFGAVGFRDTFSASTGNPFEILGFPQSDEPVNEMTEWLGNLKSKGGGNNDGESSLSGILMGLRNSSWPNVQRRVIALFSDECPHLPDQGVRNWEQFRKSLHNNDIDQIHLFTPQQIYEDFIGVDDIGYDTYRHELEPELLEDEIRQFVRQSSTGIGNTGSGAPRLKERTSVNPFDAPPSIPQIEDKKIEPDTDEDINPFDDF